MNTYRAVKRLSADVPRWDIEWSKDGEVRGRVCEGFAEEGEALYWVFQLTRIEARNHAPSVGRAAEDVAGVALRRCGG